MNIAKMSEAEVVKLAQKYASEHEISEEIERVSYVDVNNLPDRFRSKGNFWVVGFRKNNDGDVVMEHDGTVLNIFEHDRSISAVN